VELATVFKRYAAEGTGQLALKFADTSHLCKVNIENGEAIFIKLGTLSPEESLSAIKGKTLLEANFIKGFKTRKRLSEPITDKLVGVSGSSTEQETIFTYSEVKVASGQSVPAGEVSKMINHYVDIVGPLGVVMMENYIRNVKYVQGDEMNSDDYNELVNKVLGDLPEAFREEFQQAHR